MQNRFNTLNDALVSVDLVSHWPTGVNIGYGECVEVAERGTFISVTRFDDGVYERPIHYKTKMGDGYIARRLAE